MKHKSKDKSKGQKEAGTREMEELGQKIVELQAEKDEIFGRLQRVSADYANFQKRAAKQVADTIAYEKERMVRTLLPALEPIRLLGFYINSWLGKRNEQKRQLYDTIRESALRQSWWIKMN